MPQERDRLLHDVAVLASTDAAFRRRLLEDPGEAIFDAFGVRIPMQHRIRFIEKPEGIDTLIVLPHLQRPDGELDDDDLDAVAGGTDTGGQW